jgi:hypothetical protein
VEGDGGEGGEDRKGIDEAIQREKNSKRGRGKEKRRKRKEVRRIRLITSITSHLAISPSRVPSTAHSNLHTFALALAKYMLIRRIMMLRLAAGLGT